MSFAELKAIAKPLDDVFAVWGFGGGWAIDGAIGKVTREHHDVDIFILREDLAEWREVWPEALWYKMVNDREVELAEGEVPDASVRTLHVRDGEAFYKILLMETEGDNWVYEHDARVKMPVEEVFVAGAERLSFVNPAIALLIKSRQLREKDVKDFKAVLPFLSDFERLWLLKALETVYGEHIWMDALKGEK